MSSSEDDESFQDENEPGTTLQELAGEERSPVEESFYESYIIQSRTAVDNLYASNVLSCQKHMKVMGDLARQRRVKLSSLEREQKKLVKRMENLKEKHETHSQKRSKKNKSKSTSAHEQITDIFKGIDQRRCSFPKLITAAEDQTLTTTKTSNRLLGVPGNTLSKSCNDLTSLYNRNPSSQESTLVLPAIKPSRSHENLSETPFITHISSKVHKHPITPGLVIREHLLPIESRDSKSSWDEKNFKDQISTKVKWVPRN